MGYTVEVDAIHKPGKGGVIEVGTEVLEAYFGVSRTTLTQWKEKGCPQIKRGKWDLIAVIRWRGGLDATSDDEEENENVNDYIRKVKAEADLKEIQVQLADLDLQKARGEIIEISEVKALISRAVMNSKNLLLALPSKAAPRLVGLSVLEDFKGILEEYSAVLLKSRSKKEVDKITTEIFEELYESKTIGEISEVLTHIVEESLQELGEMEAEIHDRESSETV